MKLTLRMLALACSFVVFGAAHASTPDAAGLAYADPQTPIWVQTPPAGGLILEAVCYPRCPDWSIIVQGPSRGIILED